VCDECGEPVRFTVTCAMEGVTVLAGMRVQLRYMVL
jgi:hypothetical protein